MTMDTETLLAIGSSAGFVAFLGHGARLAKAWLAARTDRAKAELAAKTDHAKAELASEERLSLARMEGAKNITEWLTLRFDAVDQELKRCEEGRAEDRAEHEREIRSVLAEARGESVQLRTEFGHIAKLIAERLRSAGVGDAEVRELERVARNLATTPPGGWLLVQVEDEPPSGG